MLNTRTAHESGLDETFSALADPTRRAILSRLAAGEATVLELAEPFAMSLPAISRHLKVLEHAGLISRGRDAQRRPCRLRAAPLASVAAFADRYRAFWESTIDRLEEYLDDLAADGPPQPKETPWKASKKMPRTKVAPPTKPRARKPRS